MLDLENNGGESRGVVVLRVNLFICGQIFIEVETLNFQKKLLCSYPNMSMRRRIEWGDVHGNPNIKRFIVKNDSG